MGKSVNRKTAPKTGADTKKKEEKFAPGLLHKFPLQLVYICSPIDVNNPNSVEDAKLYCRFALANLFIPVAPHLWFPQFLRYEHPKEREIAMYCASCFLDKCDEVWIFGEDLTETQKGEILRAKMRGKGVRMFTEDMKEVR